MVISLGVNHVVLNFVGSMSWLGGVAFCSRLDRFGGHASGFVTWDCIAVHIC